MDRKPARTLAYKLARILACKLERMSALVHNMWALERIRELERKRPVLGSKCELVRTLQLAPGNICGLVRRQVDKFGPVRTLVGKFARVRILDGMS